MSTKDIYAQSFRTEESPGKRLFLIFLAALFAACLLGAAAYFIARQRATVADKSGTKPASGATSTTGAPSAELLDANSWKIYGALTEACTCSVPCSCNFGEGPSPHSYCYPFYSYHIREGQFGDIKLDGLHFGSADMRNGRYLFIDERADARQRDALLKIAARVIARASPDGVDAKAKQLAEDVTYTKVQQTYDDRRNHLKVAGIGEFSADYIMGLDKQSPVVVRNNTTWRIHDAIKAKTKTYRVKIGRDVVNTKDTNSNQGDFEYTSEMNFGAPVRWNCGAETNRMAHGDGESCHQ